MFSFVSLRCCAILAIAAIAIVSLATGARSEFGAEPKLVPRPAHVASPDCDRHNLVTNGSFECRESGDPPVHIETFAPGQTDLSGWEIVDPRPLPGPEDELGKLETGDLAAPWTIDWIGPTRWRAAHGQHCLDMDGGIRQAIKTEPGRTYELSFALAANPELGPNTAQMRVLIDDERHDFAFDSTGHDTGNLGWTNKSIRFKAARKETMLTFSNAQPTTQSTGVALDHVVVTDPQQKPMRYRVTETSQGPILLDTASGHSWRLTTQEGRSVWLPIPREEAMQEQVR